MAGRIAEDVIFQPYPIEWSWVMVNRLSIYKRVEPDDDVISVVDKRRHPKIIIRLVELKF